MNQFYRNFTDMLVLDPPKKERKIKLPSYVVYEVLHGHALPYKGYKDVLKGKSKPESIMGSSGLQSLIVYVIGLFIGNKIDRKKWRVISNEAGLHIDKGNNLSLDIAIFEKANTIFETKYLDTPPKIVIEVDIKADLAKAPFDQEGDYIIEKSKELIAFGVEKVIWFTTFSKKIYVMSYDDDWKIVDFDHFIPVIEDCVMNLEKLLKEEEIVFKIL